MAELIICLSRDKGTWNYVTKLIRDHKWDKVIILTDKAGRTFTPPKAVEFVVIDPNEALTQLSENVKEGLKEKISGIEVAVNFVSGSGKEHMALMSALLKLGLGIRFIALKPNSIEEI